MTTPHYRLISFNLCPFVQRSVITLNEKGTKFDIDYIDLADKPDWFLKLSPRGLVPVLDLGHAALFESAAINEFIDETTPGALMPEDAVERATHRAWIATAGDLNIPAYHLMVVEDEAAAREAANKAHTELARFEAMLGEGDTFSGVFSLVDSSIAPPLQRLTWAEKIVDFGVFDGLPKVSKWRDALLARESVRNSTVDDIESIFLDYIRGAGSPARKAPPSWLGTQAA